MISTVLELPADILSIVGRFFLSLSIYTSFSPSLSIYTSFSPSLSRSISALWYQPVLSSLLIFYLYVGRFSPTLSRSIPLSLSLWSSLELPADLLSILGMFSLSLPLSLYLFPPLCFQPLRLAPGTFVFVIQTYPIFLCISVLHSSIFSVKKKLKLFK